MTSRQGIRTEQPNGVSIMRMYQAGIRRINPSDKSRALGMFFIVEIDAVFAQCPSQRRPGCFPGGG